MYKYYRKNLVVEMRPYVKYEQHDFTISQIDIDNGSPREGDMIARNPDNLDDKWLVSEKYFKQNYEEVPDEIELEEEVPEKDLSDELEIEEKPEIVDDDEVDDKTVIK